MCVCESYREAVRHDSYHNKWARSLIRFNLDDSIFQSPNVIIYFFIPNWCAIPCAQFGVIQTN